MPPQAATAPDFARDPAADVYKRQFQDEHGFVDKVVPRTEMRETLAQLLRLHA